MSNINRLVYESLLMQEEKRNFTNIDPKLIPNDDTQAPYVGKEFVPSLSGFFKDIIGRGSKIKQDMGQDEDSVGAPNIPKMSSHYLM